MQESLRTIQRLEDCDRLVRLAGHTPSMHWLPAEGWVEGHTPTRAAILGRHHDFEWLGFEVNEGAGSFAAAVTRRLERTGRLVGIVVLSRRTRVVALGVSHPPRPVLTFHLDRPSRVALGSLQRLRASEESGALATAAHLARVLDTEAVGRRFFSTFRATLHQMQGAMPGRLPAVDRHSLALLQLTRVLFLYFVQARGWLDGRLSFLHEELDRTLAAGRSPHTDFLQPLFFGTLNQPRARRGGIARRFGAIPFLNGGLFEPHPLERRWRVTLPAPIWRDAFDTLFERFHFTLSETDGLAIAPDMLGRVFEGVMNPDERGDTGTFYTPAELVSALVRATLAGHIAARLGIGDDEAERRLEEPDAAVQALCRKVTVLDPAVGSGAFLLGTLESLRRVAGAPGAATVRRILTHNLFGVDINPAAVRLTELRLWLALLGAESGDPDTVPPLPNLDAFVRQGDSLVDPFLHATPGVVGSARDLARLRSELATATGREKAVAARALRRAELASADAQLTAAETRVTRAIADLQAQARSPSLFGEPTGLDRRNREQLEALRGRRRFLWALRRRLQREGTLPWFHYQSHFADVFASGGFDVVIGNPPWVRAEQLPRDLRRQLTARYRWWKGSAQSGYAHLPDLSIAFVERSMELTAPGGTVGLLLPAKLATAGYATLARQGLAGTMLRSVTDLTADHRARFEATTYPLALIATRREPPPGHLVRTRLDPAARAELPQARFQSAPWVIVSGPAALALDRLRQGHPLLAERFRCQLGVKTGLNDVFIDPRAVIEPEMLCWALRGRDLRAFSATPSARLLWPHASNGDPLADLPPRASAWFRLHAARLRARTDYERGPVWTLFRTGAASAPHRVVWADLGRRLEVVPLTGPHAERLIPLNSCYVLPTPDGATALRLAAWLNTTWMRAAAAAIADPASGGFRRFNARVVGSLPVPDSVLRDGALLALGERGRSGQLVQRDLDDAALRHLALTTEDHDALARLVPAARDPGRRVPAAAPPAPVPALLS